MRLNTHEKSLVREALELAAAHLRIDAMWARQPRKSELNERVRAMTQLAEKIKERVE